MTGTVGADPRFKLMTECWLKLYDLPFPTTNRSFLAYLLVLDTTPPSTPTATASTAPLRSFLCFSLPVAADPTLTKDIDKGFVRGKYVAVERIREVRNDKGEVEIEWMCASQSTPGGEFLHLFLFRILRWRIMTDCLLLFTV